MAVASKMSLTEHSPRSLRRSKICTVRAKAGTLVLFVAFNNKYQGKWIKVTGTLEKVTLFYSQINSGHENGYIRWRVRDFSKNNNNNMKGAKIGQKYTFDGMITSIGGGEQRCILMLNESNMR